MARSRKHEIGVGILVIVAVGLFAFMSVKAGALVGLGADRIRLQVTLEDAAGVSVGAGVKVAGVDVGEVVALQVIHDKALLTMEVERSAEIRQDAAIQVRARSILGEKFVAIVPRSTDAPLLDDGATLAETLAQTEIDQLVNALGPLVEELDTEALNGTIRSVNQALAEDPQRLKRILSDTELAVHNLAEASKELPGLVSEGRATLGEVRQVARDARPVLARTEAAVSRLETASQNMPQTVDEVRGLVSETRLAVADGRRLIGEVEGSTGDIRQVIKNLKEIDKVELRRLLREEGILVRLKEHEVDAAEAN